MRSLITKLTATLSFGTRYQGLAILALSSSVLGCFGQGATGANATGTKPFWTYIQNREVVSPSTGNLMVTVPLLHLPGRNGHDLNVSMVYNSGSDLSLHGIVEPQGNGGNSGTLIYTGDIVHWRWNDPIINSLGAQFYVNSQNGSVVCTGNYTLLTAESASYTFGSIDTGCVNVSGSGNSTYSGANIPIAMDDSQQGMLFDALAPLGPTAYFPDGKRLVGLHQGALDVDANGNYITYAYPDGDYQDNSPKTTNITDTLGRNVSIKTNSAGQQLLQYYNSEGALQTITVTYGGSPAVQPIYLPAPQGVPEQCYQYSYCYSISGFNSDIFQISSIVFPDGSSYSFAYDAMGDLTKIGYPGGGYTRYDYNILAPRSYYIPSLSTANMFLQSGVSPQISAKYTCPGTGIPYGTTVIPTGNTCSVPEQVTTYAPTQAGAYNGTNVVTEPDGTTTTYSFNEVNPSLSYPGQPGGVLAYIADYAPVELGHTITDVGGGVLERVSNSYESDNMHLKSRTTSRLHGESTQEIWTNSSTALYQGQYWTVQSLETDDLNTGNMIKREDFTWYTPGFDPASPYFEALKETDYLYDPAVSKYTTQAQFSYGTSVVSSGVTSSSGYSANGQHLSQTGVRGNITSALHWSSDDNAWIGLQHTYDDTGNIVKTIDARGNSTTYSYADEWSSSSCLPTGGGTTAAYVTGTTNALGQTATAAYNPCTGTVASTTDANSKTTSYNYWPTTDQVASVSYPEGGAVSYCYENTGPCSGADQSARNYSLTTMSMSPDPAVVKQEKFDGLGRTIGTEILSDPWCPKNGTETYYNNREWVSQTTFPHCSGVTGASTSFSYNGLGYPTSKQVSGSAARTWVYSGQSVTETDEVGNKTVSTIDSLGRLIHLMEPGPNNTPTYDTDYQYDAANNLTQVDQWGGASGSAGDRRRTFTYDTLSRLKTSTNPEVNTIGYSYDRNGNLVSQQDARNISANRSYDALNRLTQTIYTDGTPTECFAYDTPLGVTSISNPVGRLVAEWTQTGTACPQAGLPAASTLVTERLIGVSSGSSSIGGYDAMGRLTADLQCPSETCAAAYPSQYVYNAGGVLTGQTLSGLPNGPLAFTHSHDAASRTSLVTSSWADARHPATLFEADANTNGTVGTPYGPFGLLNGLYGAGSSSFGYATTSRSYDSHGRSQSETDYGSALNTSTNATNAMGTIDVSMNEQTIAPVSTPSTGTITITAPYGGDQYSTQCSCYETGYMGVVINTSQGQGENQYFLQDGQGNTTASIASMVASGLNNAASSPMVKATVLPGSSVINLTSTATGSGTNYQLIMVAGSESQYFSNPSYVPVASGPTMTGGQTGTGSTVSDSGTVTVTVGQLAPLTLSWTSADSASTIATRLATLMNQTSSYASVVTATTGGPTVTVTAIGPGSAGNMKLKTSVTYNSASFPSSSVAISATPLTGGTDAVAAHGPILAYQYNNATWADNGSLASVNDSIMGSQGFGYDTLNRLVSNTISGPVGTGTLSWSYDPFGNRTSQSGTGSLSFGVTQTSASYSGQSLQNGGQLQGSYNNRMDGVNHDVSGNVLSDSVGGLNFYSYDAASRLRTAGTVCYVYNAEGIRTAKGSWNGTACANITSQYILGPGGEQVTEFDGLGANAAWAHTNVFGAGKLLATYDNAGLHFHLTDWLGTNRSQVNADGTIEETCLSLPFGDSLSCTGTGTDATEHHFTGKERDQETGLDYFGARYFQSNAGRWMSPDWAAKAEPIPYAKMNWPQSFNLYAYVENNPLSMADADGHTIDCGCTETAAAGVPDSNNNKAKANNKKANKKANEKAQPAPANSQGVTATMTKGNTVTYSYADGSTVTLTAGPKAGHSFRDNNPGDLRSGHGSIGRDGGIAIYPSLEAGVNALNATLTGKYGNSSIAETMKEFAPVRDGNDPVAYAAKLASAVGVPASTKVSALTPAQLMTVQYTIAAAEGYSDAGSVASYTAPTHQ